MALILLASLGASFPSLWTLGSLLAAGGCCFPLASPQMCSCLVEGLAYAGTFFGTPSFFAAQMPEPALVLPAGHGVLLWKAAPGGQPGGALADKQPAQRRAVS